MTDPGLRVRDGDVQHQVVARRALDGERTAADLRARARRAESPDRPCRVRPAASYSVAGSKSGNRSNVSRVFARIGFIQDLPFVLRSDARPRDRPRTAPPRKNRASPLAGGARRRKQLPDHRREEKRHVERLTGVHRKIDVLLHQVQPKSRIDVSVQQETGQRRSIIFEYPDDVLITS